MTFSTPGPPARLAPLALAALLLNGCVSNRALDRTDTDSRAALNARAQRQGATVVLRSGERVRADALRLDADGATWIDRDGVMRTASHDDVAAVRFSDGLRGSARGAAIGALAGTALGLLASATADHDSFITFSPLFYALTGAASGTALGGLFGYDGVHTVYREPEDGSLPDAAP